MVKAFHPPGSNVRSARSQPKPDAMRIAVHHNRQDLKPFSRMKTPSVEVSHEASGLLIPAGPWEREAHRQDLVCGHCVRCIQ